MRRIDGDEDDGTDGDGGDDSNELRARWLRHGDDEAVRQAVLPLLERCVGSLTCPLPDLDFGWDMEVVCGDSTSGWAVPGCAPRQQY